MARFDQHVLDEIRHAVDISDIIGRHVSWDRRKTNTGKRDFWACCPFHAEKGASFHCDDRKGLYKCFGCGASGDHFRFLTDFEGLTFPKAVEEVARLGGVPLPDSRPETEAERRQGEQKRAQWAAKRERERQAQAAEEAKRRASAGAIWKASVPIPGTLAEVYLRERGGPALATPDPNLRFHPALWHELARVTRPALIGRVQNAEGAGIAVWRIYLKPDGTDKAFGKESEHSAKIGKGPAAGGAVRLGGEQADTIGLAEGIETARAVRAFGAAHPIWAALSTSGMTGFVPPAFVKRVLIYPDGDSPRRREGVDYEGPGIVAARRLKERLDAEGLVACEIVEPPVRGDYLDLWERALCRS